MTVTGTVVADERVKLAGLELRLESLQVDSLAEPELPIAADSALDKRMDWRYLDLRRPERRLIFEVQTTVEHAMREFWRSDGFIELHTPKFMGSASESGAELFKVEYFERRRLPGAVAPVLQADGNGRRLRSRVRDRPRVPREPLLHLPPRHRVHERGRGDLLDRLPRRRHGLRGALARARARARQGAARGGDRSDLRHATRRSDPPLPAGHPRRRPRSCYASAATRFRAPATTSTRPASGRCPRSSAKSRATSSRSSPTIPPR